jgi:hypothetical protein
MLAQQTIPTSRDARKAADAAECVIRVTLPALDDIVRADVECQRDNRAIRDIRAIAVIARQLVISVGLSPAGILVTARPVRRRGSSWE